MIAIIVYSLLLLAGLIVSQACTITLNIHDILNRTAMVCLGFIMIEVGLDFTIDKTNLKSYAWDYFVAATAAAFPWIICTIYFISFFEIELKEALLLGRFAAPTSAGVLFAMLAGVGLSATWLFRKARILAIFDDLDTIILLIPIKMIYLGVKLKLFFALGWVSMMLFAAYYWMHKIRLPRGNVCLLLYSYIIVFVSEFIEKTTHVEIEVLLPAFVLGCLIFNTPAEHSSLSINAVEKGAYLPHKKSAIGLGEVVKGLFMFLVGCSLPKVEMTNVHVGTILLHVCVLTILINVGKCFILFTYRREASVRERLALSIAMFPRGEVGAGILLLALGYGIKGLATTISVLSLALNLVLTGFFISMVVLLLKRSKKLT